MSGTYDATKHDMGLLKQDAITKVGLMLVRNNGGVPIYRIQDEPSWPKSFASDLTAQLYKPARLITCAVRCSDLITLKSGKGTEAGQATTIRNALIEAHNAAKAVTMYDIDGTTITVYFLAMSEMIVRDEKDRAIERQFTLSLLLNGNT